MKGKTPTIIVKNDKIIDFCLKNDNNVSNEEKQLPSILHQKISCFIAEKVLDIRDIEVLNAIKYHSTIRAYPSMTEIEVFLADKMSWKEEGYKELTLKLKELMKESKEAAVFYYLRDLNKNSRNLRLYHSDTQKAFEYFRELLKILLIYYKLIIFKI